MKYDAIVFDWDGTLYDSGTRIVDSIKKCGAGIKTGYIAARIN